MKRERKMFFFVVKGTGVTANAVYPGVVNTSLLRHTSFYNSWISAIFLKPILWMVTKNLKQGSQPVLYAAIEPTIKNESGYLFWLVNIWCFDGLYKLHD